MKIYSNLYSIRTAKGISQRKLAQKSGLGKTTIQRIETNQIMPTILTLELIAKALEMKVQDLYTVSEE